MEKQNHIIEDLLSKDHIYLLLGAILILLALLFSKNLGNHPVDLKMEKLGFDLKADRLTLFYLLGFLIIGAGIFFNFKAYESRLSRLETDLKMTQSVKEQLTLFKEYEFDLILVFDTTFNLNPKDEGLTYAILKSGDFNSTKLKPEFDDVGGTKVHLEHIKPKEKFRIIVSKGANQWTTDDIEIPTPKIRLTKPK